MRAKVKIRGRGKLKSNIKFYKKSFREAEARAVKLGGEYLEKRVRQTMSYKPGYEGHPYSIRKYPGGVQSSLIRPLARYAIRKVTGDLVAALSGRLTKEKDGWAYLVGLNKYVLPRYGLYVFDGTHIMHARDPITKMYSDKRVQRKILQIIRDELSKPQRKNYG